MARELGRRIREARVRLGLTQQELASGIVTAAFLSMVESGRREPSDEVLARISERLGLDAAAIDDGGGARRLTQIRAAIVAAAVAVERGAFAEALESGQAAGRLLRDLDEPDLRIELLHTSGRAHEGLGQLDAAIRDLVDAVEVAVGRGAADREAEITIDLVRCLCDRGDLAAAHDRAARLLERFPQDLEGSPLHGRLVAVVIGLHLTRGDQSMAQLLADRARVAFETAPDPQTRAVILWNAGLAAEANGDAVGALLLMQEARRLLTHQVEGVLLGRLHLAMAWLHTRVSPPDLDAADHELASAAESFGDAPSATDAAMLEAEAGRMRWLRGDFQGAFAHALVAVEGFAAAGQPVQMANAHLLAARAAASLADLAGSRQQVRLAQQVLATAAASRASALGWRELGDAYLELGLTEDAVLSYREALRDAGLAESTLDPLRSMAVQPTDG